MTEAEKRALLALETADAMCDKAYEKYWHDPTEAHRKAWQRAEEALEKADLELQRVDAQTMRALMEKGKKEDQS